MLFLHHASDINDTPMNSKLERYIPFLFLNKLIKQFFNTNNAIISTIQLITVIYVAAIKKKTLWPLFMDGVQLPQG